MPSATVGNGAAQSASPELGLGSHSEVMKQVINVIEKKVRNMEKKKVTDMNVFNRLYWYLMDLHYISQSLFLLSHLNESLCQYRTDLNFLWTILFC